MIYGVIMAGGRGERFWPLSRQDKPKQFLRLTSERTMLDETIERVKPMIPVENIRIVTGESMGQMVRASADYLGDRHILAEPQGKNTAMAIGLAAVHLVKEDPDAVMVVLSADHLIRPAEKLLRLLEDGCQIAGKENVLITMGIVPTRPETGYGYIKLGDTYNGGVASTVYHVAAFTEKPKAAVAQEYYYSKRHLWNAGMFIWSARTLLESLKAHKPEMHEALMAYADAIGTDSEWQAREKLYDTVESISIDYAVLEQADNVLTIKADIVWDDVGSWNALERYKDKDSDNNVVVGEAATLDTFETTIYNDADGLVACLGVSDLVIVRSANITLVAHKTKVGEIKQMLKEMSQDEERKKYL